jgi:pyruvate carboxylase
MTELQPWKAYLFAYGTLRRGFGGGMSHLLAQYTDFVGLARFQGRLYDVGSYPGLVPSTDPADQVTGDLYLLRQPEPALSLVDQYESYLPDRPEESLYLRQKQTVHLPQRQESIRAWVYIYNRPVLGLKRVPSGDYLAYLKKQ